MPEVASLALVAGLAGVVAAVGWRDHRRLRASRRGLLDACVGALDEVRLSHGGDDFPRISGRHRGRKVAVELIPDTMTMRRLPQLWLQVTLIGRVPVRSGVAALVRPAGYEFYSLTSTFHHVLDPPPGFPFEVIVRGEDAGAEAVLGAAAHTMAAILSDRQVKEVAITRNGLRVIRQAAEGRRGEHLLLRQAVFDDAEVAGRDLLELLAELDRLLSALAVAGTERAT